ncbi:ABC transporter substrate-binding protein [Roseococcus pinisoli]|uniref:ABC transporter substrate-binding protein n=1 Tax=Roseococcus pinisoli TaxID=2835040 RepID=A0ABS5QHA5_9PROT|nr:ABC transporter substrate-binding protein [Roseococcus pinisoli]MBS7812738.1 ABC transporter substrate-binding protein [Roseococcus pinisoli]
MKRLGFLVLAMASLSGAPKPAPAANLTVVLEAEIVTLDPHFIGAYITRTFGYAVFDTLFAPDSNFNYRPQMVESHTVSPDGLTWTFTLRDGLLFHDGSPVTSADVVASLQRWASRAALGGRLMAATASLEAVDAKTFRLVLKEPYGLVIETLGTMASPTPFIMPERLARTPGTERITEIVGSGPFVYSRADHRPGDRMLLRRNARYVPRSEPADFLAGGKRVTIDALDIRVVPDAGTAAAALQSGEIDYMQYAPFDLLPQFERNRRITVQNFTGPQMFTGHFRLNHAAAPFDDPAIRAVLLRLVDQNEVMQGFGLDQRYSRSCPAFFTCGGPNESDVGVSALANPSIEAARTALRATRYNNEPIVLMVASDLEAARVSTEILADRMRRAGFNVDAQVTDWATLLARRTRRDGWHAYGVHALNVDLGSPLTNSVINFNCQDTGTVGFMCSRPMNELFDAFARAPSAEARRVIAGQIQGIVYGQGMAVPWGQFAQPAAYRATLRNLIPSAIPLFWNVEKP